jgi:hypothetical protein
MSSDMIKSKKMWVPERSYGVCVYFTQEGDALSDGDGVLCAEGIINDKNVEKRVLQAGKYWTGEDGGYIQWVAGGRKISASEKDDQTERLANGFIADPFEDMFDEHFKGRSINGK